MRMYRVLSMLMLAAAPAVAAETQEPAAEPVPEATEQAALIQVTPVSLTTVGDVDPALAGKLREWVTTNTGIEMPDLGKAADAAATFDEVVDVVAAKLPADSVGTVVLYAAPETVTNHGMINREKRVAVVNLRAMATDDPQVYEWRLQRQVMRAFGFLMGLDLSPNPQSVMSAYGTLEELDRIGRNFDPPWLIQLQENARDLGIAIDTNSPFFLLN